MFSAFVLGLAATALAQNSSLGRTYVHLIIADLAFV